VPYLTSQAATAQALPDCLILPEPDLTRLAYAPLASPCQSRRSHPSLPSPPRATPTAPANSIPASSHLTCQSKIGPCRSASHLTSQKPSHAQPDDPTLAIPTWSAPDKPAPAAPHRPRPLRLPPDMPRLFHPCQPSPDEPSRSPYMPHPTRHASLAQVHAIPGQSAPTTQSFPALPVPAHSCPTSLTLFGPAPPPPDSPFRNPTASHPTYQADPDRSFPDKPPPPNPFPT